MQSWRRAFGNAADAEHHTAPAAQLFCPLSVQRGGFRELSAPLGVDRLRAGAGHEQRQAPARDRKFFKR